MDRASGSGVFARDPDALLDLIELPLDDKRKEQIIRNAQLDAADAFIRKTHPEMVAELPVAQDCAKLEDYITAVHEADKWLAESTAFKGAILAAKEAAESRTALRIDGTLREFRKFPPKDIWFDFPLHRLDETGTLQDIKPEDESIFRRQRNLKKRPTKAERQKEQNAAFDEAFAILDVENTKKVKIDELADMIGATAKTVKNRVKAQPEKYLITNTGEVILQG